MIKRWNPELIMKQWIESGIKQDNHYRALFPEEALLQSNPSAKETKCAIPLKVDKHLAISIFIKLKVLQNLIVASSSSSF
jgi:hypothetical protein